MFKNRTVSAPRHDPFAATMQEFEELDRKRRSNEARKEARAAECAQFWREKQTMLAEKHAEALASIDYFKDDVERSSAELDRKLKIGYRLMLQQSDARWSKQITDRALRLLDHDPMRFRLEAGVTG